MEFQREPGRIYAEEEGRVIAEVTFPDRDGAADIDHTFVDDTLRGQGVAGQLLRAAADQIRAEGKRARATCSYAEIWFERHPEEADLLCPGETTRAAAPVGAAWRSGRRVPPPSR